MVLLLSALWDAPLIGGVQTVGRRKEPGMVLGPELCTGM